MAISAQNVVVAFGASTLREIQDLEVECRRVESDTYTRDVTVGPRSAGTLLLRGYSMTGLPHSSIGRWQIMLITVPATQNQRLILWRGWARYDQCVENAVRNGAVLFAFRFTLWEPFPDSGTLYTTGTNGAGAAL